MTSVVVAVKTTRINSISFNKLYRLLQSNECKARVSTAHGKQEVHSLGLERTESQIVGPHLYRYRYKRL